MGWTWSPSDGFWQHDQGLPAVCDPVAVATTGQERRHAYDFWISTVFYDFKADQPDGRQRRDFQANASGLISGQGSFFKSTSYAISGGRSAAHARSDCLDVVTLGLIFSGRRCAETAGGVTSIAEPATFFAYDAARASTVNWTRHRSASLVLPRRSVISAIDRDVPSEADLAQRLNCDPLAPFLRAHLHQMVQHGAALDAIGSSVALAGLTDLALGALRSAYRQKPQDDDRSHGRALLTAARAFIERNLARSDLDAAMLATALGLSRAGLYRLFSGQEQSVAAAIRAARLAKARSLLSTTRELSIAEIAHQCGLDTPHFSRMFREHFGYTPSQAREQM